MSRSGGFSSAPSGIYQSAGTSMVSPTSQPHPRTSVELCTVTELFGGRIGGPPNNLVARPYRLKTMVPIALSRPENGGAPAVEVITASAGAAKATAAVSAAATVLSVRAIGTMAATGSTGVSMDAVAFVAS